MTWLTTPWTDGHQYFDTRWGLHLLRDSADPRDKKRSIFGADDKQMLEHLPQDLISALFGATRRVFALANNGTSALMIAQSNAAAPSRLRLPDSCVCFIRISDERMLFCLVMCGVCVMLYVSKRCWFSPSFILRVYMYPLSLF